MVLENLCTPALIYVFFSLAHITIDTLKGFYNMALMKFGVGFIFTLLLNYLCQKGLGIVSWFIVFIPFILMTVIITILLMVFGIDPRTGKINLPSENQQLRYYDAREESRKMYSLTENTNNLHKEIDMDDDAFLFENNKDIDIEKKINNQFQKENRVEYNNLENNNKELEAVESTKITKKMKNSINNNLLSTYYNNYNNENVNTIQNS